MKYLTFTAVIIAAAGITMSKEMKTYYVEIPQTDRIFIVKGTDRLDAISRIGATVFEEKEFEEAWAIYNDNTNTVFEGGEFQKPKFIDLTKPRRAGPVEAAP